MKRKLPLMTFRLQNFKAVQDSKTIKFTPLTGFIGNKARSFSALPAKRSLCNCAVFVPVEKCAIPV